MRALIPLTFMVAGEKNEEISYRQMAIVLWIGIVLGPSNSRGWHIRKL